MLVAALTGEADCSLFGHTDKKGILKPLVFQVHPS